MHFPAGTTEHTAASRLAWWSVTTSLLQGLLSSSGNAGHLLVNASATYTAQHSAASEPVAAPKASDTPTHSSAAMLPGLHLLWACYAQAAVQSAVLGAGTAGPSTPTPTAVPGPDPSTRTRPPGRSILQESFWRHSHPQLKARSSAAHPALDWLYPALAAVAALEQAVLHPLISLTYDTQFAAQVRMLHLVAQGSVPRLGTGCRRSACCLHAYCWGHAGAVLGLC